MMDSELNRLFELFASEKDIFGKLDKCLEGQAPWQPGNDELLGSIERFRDTNEAADGTAFFSEGCIVVEQGSFVRVKEDVRIISPDFTRCVAALSRDHNGIFFAHSTEHNDSIIQLLKKYSSVEGSSAFVPTDPPDDLNMSLADREGLKKLREQLLESGVRVVSYPWSDFPPTQTSTNEGYVVSVSQSAAVAVKTSLVEDDSKLGYHHKQLANEPVISF